MFPNYLKTEILKGKTFLSPTRLLILTFFPPKDLYHPLLTTVLNLERPNCYIDQELRHSYAGKYEIGLQVTGAISMRSAQQKSDLRLGVCLSSLCAPPFLVTIGGSLSPWWGLETNGFTLIHYWVPTDLPIDVPIKCAVTIEQSSSEFVEKYGDATLYIRKSSEL